MPLLSVNSWFGTKSAFFTQTMRHCVPNPGVILITGLFFFASVFFIIISAIAFSLGSVQAYGREYYSMPSSPSDNTSPIAVTVPVRRLNVEKPLYVYYHLEDFHQNVRFYVSNISRKQLQADNFLSAGFNQKCLKSGAPVNTPCGLIYQSLFNDSLVDTTNASVNFTIVSNDGITSQTTTTHLPLNMTGIAWKEDMNSNKLYGKAFKALPNNESIAVWMRTAPLSTFDKLYGHISSSQLQKLISGSNTLHSIYLDSLAGNVTLTFTVTNNFPYGKKAIVVQQMTIFGGYYETRNLAILSTILGCILFACGLAFLVLFLERGPRSAKYQKVLEEYPIVTNSSIILAELEKTGDERVRKTIRQVKTEMNLK